jgi:hypothetical protein
MIYGWPIISRRKEYPVFHDNQEYTLEINIIIGHRKRPWRFRVQTEKSVYKPFQMVFQMVASRYWCVEISAIPVREIN